MDNQRSNTDFQPRDVDQMVRHFGQKPAADTRQHLLTNLENNRAKFVRLAQSEKQSQQRKRGRAM